MTRTPRGYPPTSPGSMPVHNPPAVGGFGIRPVVLTETLYPAGQAKALALQYEPQLPTSYGVLQGYRKPAAAVRPFTVHDYTVRHVSGVWGQNFLLAGEFAWVAANPKTNQYNVIGASGLEREAKPTAEVEMGAAGEFEIWINNVATGVKVQGVKLGWMAGKELPVGTECIIWYQPWAAAWSVKVRKC